MTREAQKKAVRKYKEKVKRLYIEFHPTETDMWEHLETKESKATYIKDLIRKYMKGE